MNRITVALLAAFDSALVALIGIAIPLVPLTVLWGVQYGTGVDWVVFWRVAADAWLLGHGADVTAQLDPGSTLAVGLPEGAAPFVIGIAPLGFALLTVLLGVRIGRRVAATPFRLVGAASALLVFLGVSLLVTLGASIDAAAVPTLQGALLPALVLGVGIAIGSGIASVRREDPDALTGLIEEAAHRVPEPGRASIAAALRGGALAAAAVVAVAAVVVAVRLVGSYAAVVAIYESLRSDVVGGLALTVGQLAFLPNVVLWAVSWLVGPGFALGTGSSVSAAGTLLGPIPAVPFLAALPQGTSPFGFAALLVPILAGYLAARRVRPVLVGRLAGHSDLLWSAVSALGIGIVGGLVLGLLAWVSGGPAGPGRLADVGPDALAVGAAAAGEIALAALIALVLVPWLAGLAGERLGWPRRNASN